MEAVLPIAQPKEDSLSKPTIRITIPMVAKGDAPTIVDIAEVMKKYREQMGEPSESEDEDFQEEEEDDSELSDDDDDDSEDSMEGEIEERELSPSEIENLLPAGPKVNRFSGVIERIERMYGGEYSKGRKQDDYDFEDSFIDDSEWKTYDDAPKTKHEGFFINRGTLELAEENSDNVFEKPKKKKRQRSLDSKDKKDKGSSSSSKTSPKGKQKKDKDELKERPKKKAKITSKDSSPAGKEGAAKAGSRVQPLQVVTGGANSNSSDHQFASPKPKSPTPVGLPPSVEAALQELERAVTTYPVVNKRMSRELEPYLYRVAVESRRTLPQGHFVAALTQRLTKALPFNERTIKEQMKRIMLSKSEEEVENLDEKIEGMMKQLKERVEKTLSLLGSSGAKWKWDRESAQLLRSIIECVEEKVVAHNKLHDKDPENKLSDRKERKKIAARIAGFWPNEQMKSGDVLRKNSAIKLAGKKKEEPEKDQTGNGAQAREEKKSAPPSIKEEPKRVDQKDKPKEEKKKKKKDSDIDKAKSPTEKKKKKKDKKESSSEKTEKRIGAGDPLLRLSPSATPPSPQAAVKASALLPPPPPPPAAGLTVTKVTQVIPDSQDSDIIILEP